MEPPKQPGRNRAQPAASRRRSKLSEAEALQQMQVGKAAGIDATAVLLRRARDAKSEEETRRAWYALRTAMLAHGVASAPGGAEGPRSAAYEACSIMATLVCFAARFADVEGLIGRHHEKAEADKRLFELWGEEKRQKAEQARLERQARKAVANPSPGRDSAADTGAAQ